MDRTDTVLAAAHGAAVSLGDTANLPQPATEFFSDEVEEVLRSYGQRGVIHELCKVSSRSGRSAFHFGWLHRQPYTMTCDGIRQKLAMTDLLPGVSRDSLLFKELKAFVKNRSQADVDAHRRVDPDKARGAVLLRAGAVTIELTVLDADVAYGTNRLINLVHEVFLFLSEYWADYLYENFQRDME